MIQYDTYHRKKGIVMGKVNDYINKLISFIKREKEKVVMRGEKRKWLGK